MRFVIGSVSYNIDSSSLKKIGLLDRLARDKNHAKTIVIDRDSRYFCLVYNYVINGRMCCMTKEAIEEFTYYEVIIGEPINSTFAAIIQREKDFLIANDEKGIMIQLYDINTKVFGDKYDDIMKTHHIVYREQSVKSLELITKLSTGEAGTIPRDRCINMKNVERAAVHLAGNLNRLMNRVTLMVTGASQDVISDINTFIDIHEHIAKKIVAISSNGESDTMPHMALTTIKTLPTTAVSPAAKGIAYIANINKLLTFYRPYTKDATRMPIVRGRTSVEATKLKSYLDMLGPHKAHFCIAGSAVLKAIIQTPASDIDIFMVNGNDQIGRETLSHLAANHPNATTSISRKAISFMLEDGTTLQLILCNHPSIDDVVAKFDVDCCCCVFTDDKIYVSERAAYAIKNTVNHVDIDFASYAYEHRLKKYLERGFDIFLPYFDERLVKQTNERPSGFHLLNNKLAASEMDCVFSNYTDYSGSRSNVSQINDPLYRDAVAVTWLYVDSQLQPHLRFFDAIPINEEDDNVEIVDVSYKLAEEDAKVLESEKRFREDCTEYNSSLSDINQSLVGITLNDAPVDRVSALRRAIIKLSKENVHRTCISLRMALNILRYISSLSLETLNRASDWPDDEIVSNVAAIIDDYRVSYLHLLDAKQSIEYMLDMNTLFVNHSDVVGVPRHVTFCDTSTTRATRVRSSNQYDEGDKGTSQWYGDSYPFFKRFNKD